MVEEASSVPSRRVNEDHQQVEWRHVGLAGVCVGVDCNEDGARGFGL